MFTNLESSLWMREAFLQAQYHKPLTSIVFLMLVQMAFCIVFLMCIALSQMQTKKLETFSEWYN